MQNSDHYCRCYTLLRGVSHSTSKGAQVNSTVPINYSKAEMAIMALSTTNINILSGLIHTSKWIRKRKKRGERVRVTKLFFYIYSQIDPFNLGINIYKYVSAWIMGIRTITAGGGHGTNPQPPPRIFTHAATHPQPHSNPAHIPSPAHPRIDHVPLTLKMLLLPMAWTIK